ncbi:MAG: FAD-dependent oxidoreductase [Alkalinema sp. RU_4_3]|nr:FAD-dependent oxidoreductase [Alkalinema sp. RU_4_3]
MLDVAIVGAGIAGLTAARSLTDQGQQVALIEKSRGLGGRLATRRLPGTHADHGVCYLKPKGKVFQRLIEEAIAAGVLIPWQPNTYASPLGITAFAKWLAQGLTLHTGERAIALSHNTHWSITTDSGLEISAKKLLLAIPAPQAIDLLKTWPDTSTEVLTQLQSVTFNPCITAIATYAPQDPIPWQGLPIINDPNLTWIALESSKQISPSHPVLVFHSTAAFAKQQFEADDLTPVGQMLLASAAQVTNLPWLSDPTLLQIHRWRYAFPTAPLNTPYLQAGSNLYLCGDWCLGDRVEAAHRSGLAVAVAIDQSSV